MFCSYCGREVADGSKFCIHCGADLRGASAPQPEPAPEPAPRTEPAPVYTPAPTPSTEKPKKKGGWLRRILALLLAILIGRGVGYLLGYGIGTSMNRSSSSSGTTSSSSTIQDLITRHETVMLDEGDGFTDYYTIFYGNDTHTLTGWTVEYIGEKASGYTLDIFKGVNWEQYFPYFTEFSYTDGSDYVSFTAKMKGLTNTGRVLALADYDWIEAFGPDEEVAPLNADYLLNSLRQNGWTDASTSVYSRLHFD